MEKVSKCLAAGGEGGGVPLHSILTVAFLGVPCAVGGDKGVPQVLEAHLDESLRIHSDLFFVDIAGVGVVRVPAHGRSGRPEELAMNGGCEEG